MEEADLKWPNMAWLHFYEMSRIVEKFTETENEEKTPHSLGSARWIRGKSMNILKC